MELPQAVAIALEKNPARKMALADSQIAHANVSLAHSGFLPRISFAETATVGDDPIYAFGTRLRQGRFTQNDFALNNLNHPDPIGNFSSRFGGQWNLFDSFAKNYQLRSAKLMEQSAVKQLGRAEQQVIFRVIDSYCSIAVARKQVEVAEQMVKTAQAMLDSSTARVESGSAVESDALSARVNLASRQQDLIRAQSNLQLALTEFETALGVSLTPGQQPAATLKEQTLSAASLEETEARALKLRPDLQAVASQVEAQQNGVKAAKAAYGPRLDVFGSWQADNPSPFSNGNNNWMTGAELRIDLFSRDREARLSIEKASLSRAEAGKKMAEDNIRLDVRRAWLEHDASRQMLEVSRASVQQAEESLRMVRDRYESGLATITDLLRAEDADRTSRTNYWQSVYHYMVSYAALELAAGDLSTQSPVITQ
ncbi:MAG: TolC family protein [Terriglobales bacterium]